MTARTPSAPARNHRATAAVAIAAVALGGCGSSEEGAETAPLADPAATEASPEAEVTRPEPGELADEDERAVRVAVKHYVRALNDDDGAAVCALLGPRALEGVRLPASGGGCASALARSIGYRGSGGTPAWSGTRVLALAAVAVEGHRARVTATVRHDFSDRPEPSVEDDVIYLDRADGGWRIAKASASLYRAVGYPEPPLRALTPP